MPPEGLRRQEAARRPPDGRFSNQQMLLAPGGCVKLNGRGSIMPAMTSQNDFFMARALELARQGRGTVEPNPMVGAVLVRDGVVIAEGYHRRFGGPHAEVEAIAAARAAGADPRGATIYVTLEPCCHVGRTPPCTRALLEAGVAKVVGAMQDVDVRVAGGGYQQLRDAGVEVISGVLESRARALLSAYIKLRTCGRPWVVCKWAQTPEGFLALPPGQGRWISGSGSRDFVHRLRGFCDGICVGVGTVLADDPLLTNRSGWGKQPLRIVLDSHLRTPLQSQLVSTARQFPALIATTTHAVQAGLAKARQLEQAGVELLALPASGGRVDLGALLDELGRRQQTYLLVEGGEAVLRAFIDQGLADELLAFVCPSKSGEGTAIARDANLNAAEPSLPRLDIAELAQCLQLPQPERMPLGDDMLWRYIPSLDQPWPAWF